DRGGAALLAVATSGLGEARGDHVRPAQGERTALRVHDPPQRRRGSGDAGAPVHHVHSAPQAVFLTLLQPVL
ncbi:MAG TPA: hypothetical protein VGO16_10600, partial [Pseudonocardiaceae bacterium]|nr:hypothetical protein [Pseudonocardiaceae bacterium]